ncbi:hypothetical protein HDU79_005334 [Rhizoclosmatium sp. JEL0117]|nr:hypothetical protein HDU79_005334 [Rhizoclosmatium sp. JEL0117]
MPYEITSCEQCRKSRKGCTKELRGCSGCRSRGIVCKYPPGTRTLYGLPALGQISNTEKAQVLADVFNDWNSPPQMSDRSSAIVSNLLHVPPLQHIIDAMESPLIFDDFQNDWILQDPDLMPTWDDFQTVHLYFTTNPRALAHMAAMDVAAASTFTVKNIRYSFNLIKSTRLVITAIATYYVGDAMTEETALWFFKRARKAVILAAERPSASTAKAYYWIYIYSKMMRKDALGLPFLKMSVEMLKHLKLDIDPDDSPWLHDLNLTEIEIEERRRLYWVVELMVDG